MAHAHGAIVEYFRDAADALARERQLEMLLMAARGGLAGGPAVEADR